MAGMVSCIICIFKKVEYLSTRKQITKILPIERSYIVILTDLHTAVNIMLVRTKLRFINTLKLFEFSGSLRLQTLY